MVQLRYFEPAPAARPHISCLYSFSTPFAMTDMLRAEVPNLRIFLKGGVTVTRAGERRTYRAPVILLCGPTMNAGTIEMWPDTTLIGASILPAGWHACFGLDASEMTNRFEDCEGIAPVLLKSVLDAMQEASTPEVAIAYLEHALVRLGAQREARQQPFIDAASIWLATGNISQVDNLLAEADLSQRQVERLCHRYFGGSPKRLQRKFRTLRANNALVWNDLTDWRDAAGEDYYDQSHFIRDFKEFIGFTPKQFSNEYRALMRSALVLRRTIQHVHPISLVA
ncbi:helix-turn-helix domain-containing protein [Parvularcula marina]|uniref:AraC family transcriptional regulator n=1 Tax=Parvularcula marina TaxID=2292771 RepID=A0A371RL42_9PROT|nr:AraC family transcriptional regulator [Parvularcula marina]RFB06178.1 AraC family transcriptional regulator [Parvularcula marina]